MSEKITKLLNKHSKSYNLPKPVVRKIRKLKNQYKLDLTETLYLIDRAAQKYYSQIDETNNKTKKEQKNEKN